MNNVNDLIDYSCCIRAICHVCRDRAERIIHINKDWGVQWCGDTDCQDDIVQQFNIYTGDLPVETVNMTEIVDIMADNPDEWDNQSNSYNERARNHYRGRGRKIRGGM